MNTARDAHSRPTRRATPSMPCRLRDAACTCCSGGPGLVLVFRCGDFISPVTQNGPVHARPPRRFEHFAFDQSRYIGSGK